MILLWGLPDDDPLMSVRAALSRLGAAMTLLDQHEALVTEVELTVDSIPRGLLRTPHWSLDLEAVTAVYFRPYDVRRVPRVARAGPGSPQWQRAITVDDILASWVDLTPALVVNRPEAMASNGSKPHQSELIARFGFSIPEVLITTDPGAVREFWGRHEALVFKSISGVRSVVSRLSDRHLERLADVQWCPTQFQEYVSGQDYRVHVVGDEIFACRIHSYADDYRYASRWGLDAAVEPCDVPSNVADRCQEMALGMGLSVAGIDLRRDKDDRWFCFEVNPSPGFSYFETRNDQPIADSVARLLMSGR